MDAPHNLNRDEVRECLPGDQIPSMMTIKRWLEKAVEEGHLRKDGHGLTKAPYRYWLPQREEQWRKDLRNCNKMPELFVDLSRIYS